MTYLEISDGEAAEWFAANLPALPAEDDPPDPVRRGRLHLLLGDSISERAGLAARSREDQILSRARGGATWTSLLERVGRDITAWQTAAAASGLDTGRIIIWMTGNDVYNRMSRLSSFDREQLLRIGLTAREVVQQLLPHGDVWILGPLPRLAGEVQGATWESTASYHLERTLLKEGLGQTCSFVILGRALTRKMGRKRHELKGCDAWFRSDRVHLSARGYAKLAEGGAFPEWLTMGAAAQRCDRGQR